MIRNPEKLYDRFIAGAAQLAKEHAGSAILVPTLVAGGYLLSPSVSSASGSEGKTEALQASSFSDSSADLLSKLGIKLKKEDLKPGSRNFTIRIINPCDEVLPAVVFSGKLTVREKGSPVTEQTAQFSSGNGVFDNGEKAKGSVRFTQEIDYSTNADNPSWTAIYKLKLTVQDQPHAVLESKTTVEEGNPTGTTTDLTCTNKPSGKWAKAFALHEVELLALQ